MVVFRFLAMPMVSSTLTHECQGTSDVTDKARSPEPGPSSTTSAGETQVNGLDIESRKFINLGCSAEVVKTLTKARKNSTNSVYNRSWQKFQEYAASAELGMEELRACHILEFLQKGLDMGLSASTLKGQASAISAVTGIQWASNELIIQFFKVVVKLRPPRAPALIKWDLPLVLNFLASPRFGQGVSLQDLTMKASFLVAITSARRVLEIAALGAKEPHMSFGAGRVILRPMPDFINKVATKFHLSQEIVLPTYFWEGGQEVSPLDVGRTLKVYLEATSSIRILDSLFVIPNGIRKGYKASSRIITAWLVKKIAMAYKDTGLAPPLHEERFNIMGSRMWYNSRSHMQGSNLVVHAHVCL